MKVTAMRRIVSTSGLIFLIMWLFISNMKGQTLQEQLAGEIDIVVDIDSTGDYTSVLAAINAAPSYSATPVVIFIKNGKYLEKVEIPGQKRNLMLIGESVDSTIISWNDYSGSGVLYFGIIDSKDSTAIGTSTSHTLYIDADDVTLMNLTVENSAGDVGQAVAINLGADRTTIVRCRLMGNQDTFYTWGYGRFYIKDTYVEGDVDFIFGRGAALFDSCQINANKSSNGGGYLTAASTNQDWLFGYVFNHCKLTANPDATSIKLGRPWGEYAQTVFMNTYMDSHIVAEGWSDWDGRSATCYYAEYNNLGPGYKPASRVSWAHILDSAEASAYTMESIFASNVNPSPFSSNWTPGYQDDTTYIILKNNTELLFMDSSFNRPELVNILVNDSAVTGFDPEKTGYTFVIPFGTTETPVITVVPLDTLAAVVITNPDTVPGSTTIKVTSRNKVSRTYSVNYTIASSISKSIIPGQVVFKIMNNPCRDVLRVEYKNGNSKNLLISIYSVSGTLVCSEVFEGMPEAQQIISVNTEGMPDGMYFFTIKSNGNIAGGKFMKISK